MGSPRKKEVHIFYNGIDAGRDLFPYLEHFKYEDSVDASDAVSLTLSDRDLKWSRSWMPEKEDKISPSIVLENWSYEGEKITYICGDFIVDDFSFSAPPVSCEINGVSAPANTEFKESKNSKTWESATVRIIAQEIASRYGLKLEYDSPVEIQVEKMEQNEQTDSDFLSKLCKKYGLGMKVYAYRLVIWSFKEYYEKPPVTILTPDMVAKWIYKSTMQGTYTGARVTYTNPGSKESIAVLVGKEGRLCNINEKADNEADARLIGENAIRNANRKETTMNITLFPRMSVWAASNLQIKGFGNMDGKYFVEKVSHNLDKSVYMLQVSISRIPEIN